MINRVVLIGNLCRDVRVDKTQSGLSVCSFTIAVNRQRKEDDPDYINVIAWRKTAEFLGSYAKKGDTVAVDGRIQTRSFENKQGQRVYVTEVIAEDVNIVRKKAAQAATGQAAEPAVAEFPEISEEDLPF